MDTTTVNTGELNFSALTAGPVDGRPVLFLHGFPQSAWSWRHQLEVLGVAGYRAVAFDQRGYAAGARPEATEAYRTSNLVADVLAVAHVMGWERFDLVGHDWGAAVAWQVAGRHPEKIRTLTILSVPHPLAFTKALGGDDQKGRSSYIEMFRQVGVAEEMFLADAGDGRGPGAGLRGLFAQTGLSEAESEPYVRILTTPGAMTAALNWYRAADGADLLGLAPISMPTMYVWSTNDPALGREAAEATADHVSGRYRFEILEGVSHWIAEEAPDAFNELLLDHLAGG